MERSGFVWFGFAGGFQLLCRAGEQKSHQTQLYTTHHRHPNRTNPNHICSCWGFFFLLYSKPWENKKQHIPGASSCSSAWLQPGLTRQRLFSSAALAGCSFRAPLQHRPKLWLAMGTPENDISSPGRQGAKMAT